MKSAGPQSQLLASVIAETSRSPVRHPCHPMSPALHPQPCDRHPVSPAWYSQPMSRHVPSHSCWPVSSLRPARALYGTRVTPCPQPTTRHVPRHSCWPVSLLCRHSPVTPCPPISPLYPQATLTPRHLLSQAPHHPPCLAPSTPSQSTQPFPGSPAFHRSRSSDATPRAEGTLPRVGGLTRLQRV